MRDLFRTFVCLLLCFQTIIANATIKPNSLFSDHVVLQKGKAVPVWGTGEDGEKVSVSFHGQIVTAITSNGKWMVKLAALPYISIGASMVITGQDTVITVNDVMVGEVWLCSGQSNMERQLGPRPPQQPITDWEKERDAATYPLIRQFYVPLNYSVSKIDDVKSKWTTCSPETVVDFTAVGYFFAKDLYKKLNVPIGIILSAFGGTPAEDWTSKEALVAVPELADFMANYKKIVSVGYQPPGQLMNGLYNGMLNPLLPYAIRGVAWYQGEANNDRTQQYPLVLATMISNWRKDFQEGDFPFLIVQIAPYKDMRPELREAQLKVRQQVKNTALIVITDCGDSSDIHPPRKGPVGERLAIAARGLVYQEKLIYEGPIYKSHKLSDQSIILSFKNTGKGLISMNGAPLKGFMIAGADKNFVPANALIKNGKVIVSSNEVKKPVAVRYGWANVPNVNLYNVEGLPASPFRTDANY